MSSSRFLGLAVAASLFALPAAHAAVVLIAKGQLSGTISDLSRETAAPLENGTAGNLLGGIGSRPAYAGCNTFVAVPDRGPNAVSYNAALDDTVSYINRFETPRLSLSASPAGSDLPYVATPKLVATTLLHTSDRLVYGSGAAAGVGDGAPALNRVHYTHYFTGRVASKGMEGFAISPDGKTLFGGMQSPLLQDGGSGGAHTRILHIDLRTGKMQQFAYPLTNFWTAKKPKYMTISDVVAVNDHVLLMDERDGKGIGAIDIPARIVSASERIHTCRCV